MEGYVRNLNAYIANGDYIDLFAGMDGETPINHVCIAPAYDENGEIKRNVGTWYRDIANVWTKEMDMEARRKF